MHVQRITVEGLKYVSKTDCYEAGICLEMTDQTGDHLTNAYLIGRAERRVEEGCDVLALRLLRDAYRQMSWMPEFRLGLSELKFPSDVQSGLAA